MSDVEETKEEIPEPQSSIKRRSSILATAQMLDGCTGLTSINSHLINGADPNAQDGQGCPALVLAAGQPRSLALAELIAHKADVNCSFDGLTVLQHAAKNNCAAHVSALLAAGATYNDTTFSFKIIPRGLSYAVADALAKALVPMDYVMGCVPPFLGLTCGTEPGNKGLRVIKALQGQSGGHAGMRSGDLITKVDDAPVACQEDWDGYLKTKLPCDHVTVTLTHHGDKEAVELKLIIGAVGFSIYELECLVILRQKENQRIKALRDMMERDDERRDDELQQMKEDLMAKLMTLFEQFDKENGKERAPVHLLNMLRKKAPCVTIDVVKDIMKEWPAALEEQGKGREAFVAFMCDYVDNEMDIEELMKQLC